MRLVTLRARESFNLSKELCSRARYFAERKVDRSACCVVQAIPGADRVVGCCGAAVCWRRRLLVTRKPAGEAVRCRIHSFGLDGSGRVRNAPVPPSDGHSHSFATTDRDTDVHACAHKHIHANVYTSPHKHADTDPYANADGDSDRDPHQHSVAHGHIDSDSSSHCDVGSVSDP